MTFEKNIMAKGVHLYFSSMFAHLLTYYISIIDIVHIFSYFKSSAANLLCAGDGKDKIEIEIELCI